MQKLMPDSKRYWQKCVHMPTVGDKDVSDVYLPFKIEHVLRLAFGPMCPGDSAFS